MKKKQLAIIASCVLLALTTACRLDGDFKPTPKPTSGTGKTTVTFSIKESNSFYQVVEKKFEAKYPDIDLEIQAYKQEGSKPKPGWHFQYIKTMNTEILAGKGADVIEMSSLPVDEYVNKKLLVNMSDLMEKDKSLNKSDLQMNVLDSVKINGSLYTMPYSFSLRTFVGDGDALKNVSVDDKSWTWQQYGDISKHLIEQAGQGDKRYAIAGEPQELILEELVVDSYNELVDRTNKKANFDSALFVDMLQQVKRMYDDGIMTSEAAEPGKQLFYSMRVVSPEEFITPYMLFNNPKLLHKPHAEGQSGGPRIFTSDMLGIKSSSNVKEEAWTFIAFLLSEEVQTLQERKGFSLLTSLNEKKLNEIQKQMKNGTFKLPDGKAIQASDEAFAQFKQFTKEANNHSSWDAKVTNIVYDETQAFFAGQKSAEEVAKLIQNRVTTFLNE
ncbi:ABC transporter substrate-binding protein [Paenibacillus arenosi]|uniref:Carbohydrate ABC transporter substrate-binding protein n=1 Tax=Paenibacillus arenosi TaxID=2774142 RepID=A0ABR9AWJ7_9BACL|nr:ABC transporter substrate-binding protein [Paenibacillus arenosi]MBD8497331.1 carbohydrate ABC transporter substrate-binding protein [Paenibacillus arenosi]